jgi:hypothetical protein
MRFIVAGVLVALAVAATAAPSGRRVLPEDTRIADSAAGATLYREGRLQSGAALVAERAGMPALEGEAAACVNCHRRSGLGSIEARNFIPPVAGRFLYHVRDDAADVLPYLPNAHLDRSGYDDATLARAIREGVDADGRVMSYLMPRYDLPAADMAALVQHLKSLGPFRTPGVSDTEVHFATIQTPDADPVRRAAVLTVLRSFFAERNDATPTPVAQQQLQTSGRGAFAKRMLKVNRNWVLHEWILTGAPSTWRAQLAERFRREPVYAVLTSVVGPNYAPVRDFCESTPVPCLFPVADAPPPDGDADFHSIYFSRGVGLEADLIAGALTAHATAPRRVRVVYREGDAGSVAWQRLVERLKGAAVTPVASPVAAGAPAAAVARAARAGQADATVLFLRPNDLAALDGTPSGDVYVSGLMGGDEAAPLPPSWHAGAHLAYGIDLPIERRVRLDYAFGWFRIRRIPVTDTRAQADTFLACGIVSETVKHMVDAFVPDYLVEKMEDTLEHRVLTGYYPRLSLGPHQRYASKGGRLVRFTDATGDAVAAEGDWVVP